MSVIPSIGTTDVKQITCRLKGDTLYVGGSGPNNYTRIQDAIDDASNGDTVFVYDDSSPYYETLQIKRGINLIGEDKNTTVIDGNKQDSVIEILNEDVMVSGFTIWNCKMPHSEFQYAVVKINSCQNVTIFDNIITIGGISEYHDTTAAIYLKQSCHCSILDNYVFEEHEKRITRGIMLNTGSSNNLISGNTIAGNYTGGIKTSPACVNNIISENYIHHNDQGINVRGSDSEIINNRIVNNSWEGINLAGEGHNTVSGNIVSYNGDAAIPIGAIDISSDRNIISDNEISYNQPLGIYVSFSYGNVITGNNFIDNGRNAYFSYERRFFPNVWRRNYWSDFSSEGPWPKIIRGNVGLLFFFRTWINFDWHPAQEPYDIGV